MSWIVSPTKLRLAYDSAGNINESSMSQLLIGMDEDTGYYCYIKNGTWIISQYIGQRLSIDSDILYPDFRSSGSYCFYTGGTWNIYYSSVWGAFLLSRNGYPYGSGVEYWMPNDPFYGNIGHYEGYGGWFTNSSPTETFNARGSDRGAVLGAFSGPTKTVSIYNIGDYISNTNTMLGVYTNESGNKKYVGLPYWTGSDGVNYTRSLNLINSKYTYGSINYIENKWIIGNIGDEMGWWEGSEPSKENEVIFYFKKLEGSTIENSDITIIFSGYTLGSNTIDNAYLTQVAYFRNTL